MAAANRAACEGSIPMLQASDAGDVPTGLERCVDGRYHIVSVETCQFPASVTGSCSDQRVVECRVDRDCGPLAFCNGVTKGLNSTCECQQACISDDDCDPGFACLCAGEYTSCVEAHCRTDADCDGGLCRLATDATDCERSVLACERVGSTCADHSACGECEQCMYVGERCAFECVELTGICAAGCQ